MRVPSIFLTERGRGKWAGTVILVRRGALQTNIRVA